MIGFLGESQGIQIIRDHLIDLGIVLKCKEVSSGNPPGGKGTCGVMAPFFHIFCRGMGIFISRNGKNGESKLFRSIPVIIRKHPYISIKILCSLLHAFPDPEKTAPGKNKRSPGGHQFWFSITVILKHIDEKNNAMAVPQQPILLHIFRLMPIYSPTKFTARVLL